MTLNFGVVRVARSAAMLDSVAPSMVKTRHLCLASNSGITSFWTILPRAEL